MIREMNMVSRQIHQALLLGEIKLSIEKELSRFKKHICQSFIFCSECIEFHKNIPRQNNCIITKEELDVLFGCRLNKRR